MRIPFIMPVPGPPTAPIATASSGSASVTWTPPANNGGSAITAYTVRSTPGNFTATASASPATVTGLTNGTSYTFTVVATNSLGNSVASAATKAVIPITTADSPTNVTGVGANASARISWTASASNGSAITRYTVTSSPGGITALTANGTTTTATVVGLTNGTSYTFTVVATNGAGSSAASAPSASVTPITIPGAPTALLVTPQTGAARVAFTAPASNGGSPITAYTVTSTPGNFTATAASSPITVSGLTNATSYTFKAVATNAAGNSVASAPSAAAMPYTVPNPPINVTCVPRNASVAVSWKAPAITGGSAITSYTVTSSPGGMTAQTANGTTLTATVLGLTNATSYTFTVVATNAAGASLASTVSPATIPYTVADSPTNVTGVAANASATISWTAPVSNGSAITKYTVTASPGGKTALTANGTTTTATVLGLTNGTSYTFSVVATNAAGASAASVPSAAIVPITIPGAPTALLATRSDSEASVAWTAPASNGGSPITAYTVTSTPGNFTAVAASSPATVTGLTNGISYTFKAVATNAAGNSVASAPSKAVIPITLADPPTNITGVIANASAKISWTASASNGGSAITRYTVTSSPEAKTALTANGTATTATVVGLTNGTSYTFTVVATNGAGSSAASAPSAELTPITVPGAPTTLLTTAGVASASVSFTPPLIDGGSDITGYTITSKPGNITATGTTSPILVAGLTNATSYTFTAIASNAAGNSVASAASAATIPRTVPNAPTAVVATRGNSSATLKWAAPAFSGGSAITNYTIVSDPDNISVTVGAVLTGAITGLTNGTPYTFTVIATNIVGDSTASAASAAITPAASPSAPTNVVATPGNASASLIWDVPASNGAAITSYVATSSPGSKKITTTTNSGTITGLTNGTSYTFTVVAINVIGSSLASAAQDPIIPVTLPSAPTKPLATKTGIGEVGVTWTAPTSNGGAAITSYQAISTPGSITVDTPTPPASFSNLTPGTSYTFTVKSMNSVGYSPASAATTAIVPYTVPGAPTNLLGTVGNGQVTVKWTAPVSNGFSPILQYRTISTPGSIQATSTATSVIVSGLSNGTPYTFATMARNLAGWSALSASSAQVVPCTVPGLPTNVEANTGNQQALVSWTAPVNNGGSDILRYAVLSSPMTQLTYTPDGATTSAIATGLTNGTSYTFNVRAINAAGSSAGSVPSAAIVPTSAVIPSAPTDLVCTPGVSQISVEWTAAYDGGSAITSYIVTSSPGGLTESTSGNTLSATITGLEDGTPYTFTVVARNVVGSSVASSASAPSYTLVVPSAPRSVSALAANQEATVSWTAPTSNGGGAITSYTVTSTPGGLTTTTDGNNLSATVTDLDNLTAYTFRVVATNAAGSSVASAASAAVTPGYITFKTVNVFAGSGAAGSEDGQGIAANFNYPIQINYGNNLIYVADAFNNVIRTVDVSGNVSTLGNFNQPTGVAVASNGVVYVADSGNIAIRTIDLSGNITTLADTGFGYPASISLDSNNNLYVADFLSGAIRKVDPSGNVITIASGLSYPRGVYASTNGNIYVAESGNNRILAIDLSGTVTTLAGDTAAGYADGVGTSALFNYPVGLAEDNSGNLFVSEYGNQVVRVIKISTGVVTTYATGFAGPLGLCFMAGTLVVANTLANTICKIGFAYIPDPPTDIQAVAGEERATVSWTAPVSNGGLAITSYTVKSHPGGFTATTSDLTATVTGLTNLTSYTFTVKAVSAAGKSAPSALSAAVTPARIPVLSAITFAGSGSAGFADGQGTAASFSYTSGIKYRNGKFYMADTNNNAIRVIDLSANVSTLAGSGGPEYADGQGTSASFAQPYNLALSSNDRIFVSDSYNNRIRMVDLSGNVTTFAGSTSGTLDGQGAGAQFDYPMGIAIDASDNLYVCDYNNGALRKIDTSANVITIATGFSYPRDLCVGADGILYIADTNNNRICAVDASGNVTTLAGSGSVGYADGIGSAASFNYPFSIAADTSGNLFVGDLLNNCIRKINISTGEVTTYLSGIPYPNFLCLTDDGTIYFSTYLANIVCKIGIY